VVVDKDRLMGFPGEFNLVRCTSCGPKYLNPQLDSFTLRYYYSGEYPGNSTINLASIVKGRNLKSKLLKVMYFHLRMHVLKDILKVCEINKNTKLLDIGCGNGGFLYFMKEKIGIKGDGIEISKDSADFASKKLGLNIINSSVEDATIKGKYDLITAFQYFEHEPDPNRLLKKVHSSLNDNGVLLLELPNANSLMFRIFKKYWYNLDIPRHLYNYSPETVTKILEKNGFSVKRIVKYKDVSFVSSFLNSIGLGIKVRKLANLPIYLSIPLYYLPELVVDSLVSLLTKPFFDTDIMAVYATVRKFG